jgi:hypothetical protein
MLRAWYGETHLQFDLHAYPYVSLHALRRNSKQNHIKLPSGRAPLVRCEILQRTMTKTEGRCVTMNKENLVQTLARKGNA